MGSASFTVLVGNSQLPALQCTADTTASLVLIQSRPFHAIRRTGPLDHKRYNPGLKCQSEIGASADEHSPPSCTPPRIAIECGTFIRTFRVQHKQEAVGLTLPLTGDRTRSERLSGSTIFS